MDFIIIALFSLVYLIDFMISYSCCVLSERFETLHFSPLLALYYYTNPAGNRTTLPPSANDKT
jgi:hypothetical protein